MALRSETGEFITTTLILVGCAFVLAMGIVIVLFITDDAGADIGNSEVDAWCVEYMPDTPRSECRPDTAW